MLFSFLQSEQRQTRLASPRDPLISCVSCGSVGISVILCERARGKRELTVGVTPTQLGCSSRQDEHLTLNMKVKSSPTGLTVAQGDCRQPDRLCLPCSAV